jgi:hypothetical protein
MVFTSWLALGLGCDPPCSSGYICSSNCQPCIGGKYSNTPTNTCLNCTSGYFSTPRSASCTACASGNYSLSGYSACLVCTPGTVSNKSSSSCTNCTVGKYSSVQRSGCLDCTQGTFTNVSGSSICSFCAPGNSSNSGQSYCFSCIPGKYSNQSAICTACPSGKYGIEAGRSACNLCPSGTYMNQTSSTTCNACPIGRYSETDGSTFCSLCINSYTKLPGSFSRDQCNLCVPGYYGNPPETLCSKCPVGVDGLTCPIGSLIPFVDVGHYRKEDNVALVYTCIPKSVCYYTGYNVSTTCAHGHQGFMCSSCEVGFYKLDGLCRTCPPTWILVVTIVVVVFVLSRIMFKTLTSSFSFSGDVRILLQALQTLALYPDITERWPSSILALLQFFSLAVSNSKLINWVKLLSRTSKSNWQLQNVRQS